MNVKKLKDNFTKYVDGMKCSFTRIASQDGVYTYERVDNDDNHCYEIIVPKLTQCVSIENINGKAIYTPITGEYKEAYPATDSFGVNAWCASTQARANELFIKAIKNKQHDKSNKQLVN